MEMHCWQCDIDIECSEEMKIPVIEYLFRRFLPDDAEFPRKIQCMLHKNKEMAILVWED